MLCFVAGEREVLGHHRLRSCAGLERSRQQNPKSCVERLVVANSPHHRGLTGVVGFHSEAARCRAEGPARSMEFASASKAQPPCPCRAALPPPPQRSAAASPAACAAQAPIAAEPTIRVGARREIDLWSFGDPWARFLARSASNLLSNATRGVFAQFLVGAALDCLPAVRDEWAAWDLCTRAGIKVEVKTSAYLQSWSQKKPSTIRFGIGQRRAWNAEAGCYDTDVRYHADVFVFCFLSHMERTTVNPLDVSQWRFFVLASSALGGLSNLATIGLGRLMSLGPIEASWRDLADAVGAAAAG